MFNDEAKVVAVLKTRSEDAKLKKDTCTLRNLKAEIQLHPELFNPNMRRVSADKKDTTVAERPYSDGAIKQALYRLVVKHKIWLSRG